MKVSLLVSLLITLSFIASADTTFFDSTDDVFFSIPSSAPYIPIVTGNPLVAFFAFGLPCMALVFTVLTFWKQTPIPAIFSTALWLASSMLTSRIKFISDFGAMIDLKYIDRGNIEVGQLFLAIAIIMGVYTSIIILVKFYEARRMTT